MSGKAILETPAGAVYRDVIDLEKVKAIHKPMATEQHSRYADGNTAAAYACLQMWRMPVYVGFPITPSTKWLETVASVVGSGQVGKKSVKLMEAEHAVADYMTGVAAGCRDLIVATATSSVGLDHMTESTRSLGASGLGNVMLVNVYRATANYPLCIEGDPSDTLAHRDDGWIQVSCRGAQQIYDTVIQMPCVGMHPDIMTPTMPGYFGIKDSHRSSRLIVETDEAINAFHDAWIPTAPYPGLINGDTAMGNCVTSRHFQGFKINQRCRMERVFDRITEIGKAFETTFGRKGLELVESLYGKPGADLTIVGMGPDMGTAASMAAEWERRHGMSVQVLATRLLTPFPSAEYARLLNGSNGVLVVNHAHHYGSGHLTADIAQSLYASPTKPSIVPCFAGMGGADLSDATWSMMVQHAFNGIRQGTAMVPPVVVHEGRVVWPS